MLRPLYVGGILKEYWIWNKPVEGHQYIAATPGEKVMTDPRVKRH